MKPSKCRVVLFHPISTPDSQDSDPEASRPAIITKVHSDTCVNLYVLWDASDGRMDPFVTSATLAKEIDGVVSPKVGDWSWPPRV